MNNVNTILNNVKSAIDNNNDIRVAIVPDHNNHVIEIYRRDLACYDKLVRLETLQGSDLLYGNVWY